METPDNSLVSVEIFKAQKATRRFRANQKVFITSNQANHMYVRFRWRGKGRWVNGIIKKWSNDWTTLNPVIGVIKTIQVNEKFKLFLHK